MTVGIFLYFQNCVFYAPVLLPRRRVLTGPIEEEPRQRPEVDERVNLLLADGDRSREALLLAHTGVIAGFIEEIA